MKSSLWSSPIVSCVPLLRQPLKNFYRRFEIVCKSLCTKHYLQLIQHISGICANTYIPYFGKASTFTYFHFCNFWVICVNTMHPNSSLLLYGIRFLKVIHGDLCNLFNCYGVFHWINIPHFPHSSADVHLGCFNVSLL